MIGLFQPSTHPNSTTSTPKPLKRQDATFQAGSAKLKALCSNLWVKNDIDHSSKLPGLRRKGRVTGSQPIFHKKKIPFHHFHSHLISLIYYKNRKYLHNTDHQHKFLFWRDDRLILPLFLCGMHLGLFSLFIPIIYILPILGISSGLSLLFGVNFYEELMEVIDIICGCRRDYWLPVEIVMLFGPKRLGFSWLLAWVGGGDSNLS